MTDSLHSTTKRINARIRQLTERARASLRGECEFGLEDVREIREPIQEMEPIVINIHAIRESEPALSEQLDEYRSHIHELQTTLDQIRIMLLARQASLQATRAQMASMNLWFAAFQQTR